jgi:hypothetical protein
VTSFALGSVGCQYSICWADCPGSLPAAAQDAAPVKPSEADREILQALQLDLEHLALESPGAPAIRNHCPPNYCNIGKQECAAECAPRIGTGACFHQFCEVICSCSG